MAEPWTHTWVWSKRPVDRNRKGQRCRVLSLVAAGASGPVVVRALGHYHLEKFEVYAS